MRPVAFVIVLFLFSCEFTPDGEFTVDVPEGNLSDVVINLNQDSDTVYIDDNKPFRFTISTGSHNLLGGRIFVGDYEIASGMIGADLVFTLYPYNIGSGTHKMIIRYHLSSGSGSLADVAGHETLIISKELVLIVDIDSPPARIVTVDSLNGTLTLHWDAYDHWKFKEYIISIQKPLTGGSHYTEIERITITDKHITSWNDQKYMGGRFRYQLHLIAGNRVATSEVYVDSKISSGFEFTGEGSNIKIHWAKPTFYNNIHEVEFSGPSGVLMLDVEQTSFEEAYPYPFGYAHSYSILLHNGSYYHTVWQIVPVYYGKPTPPSVDLSYLAFIGNDRYLTWNSPGYSGYLEIRGAELEVLNRIQVPVRYVAVSPGHAHIYFFQDGSDEGIYRLDPQTLTTEKIVSVNELLGPAIIWGNAYDRTVERMSVSDNNRIALTTNSGSYVIDLETLDVLYSVNESFYLDISRQGDYLTKGRDILRWTNGGYVLHHTFSVLGSMRFTGDTPEEILVDQGFNFRRYQVSDMTVLGDFNHSLDWKPSFSYDPVSRKAFYKEKLIDVNTMSEVPIRYSGPGSPVLMNNMMIDRYYMAPLQEILKLQP